MGLEADGRTIRWRLNLAAPPERVHQVLATPEGRARFWALSAPEQDRIITFRFRSGQMVESRILELASPDRFVVTYFGGSRVAFWRPIVGAGPISASPRPTSLRASCWRICRVG